MAGPSTCCNLAPTNKDELAENALEAPTEDNNTFIPSLAIFCAQTSTLA